MTPERWQLIDKLLEQALEQEPERRSAFLDAACHGDAALRLEVESLLSAHGKADGFTEAGPMRKPVKTGVEESQLLTGRQVGHYQKFFCLSPFHALFALSVESREKRRLTSPPALARGDSSPAFSPDGRTITFVRMADFGSNELYLLGVDKSLTGVGKPRKLSLGQQQVSNLVWEPEGRDIIFSDFGYRKPLGPFHCRLS